MYRLNDSQQRLVADVAALADAKIAPHASTVDQTGAFPRPSLAAHRIVRASVSLSRRSP